MSCVDVRRRAHNMSLGVFRTRVTFVAKGAIAKTRRRALHRRLTNHVALAAARLSARCDNPCLSSL